MSMKCILEVGRSAFRLAFALVAKVHCHGILCALCVQYMELSIVNLAHMFEVSGPSCH